ncbi:MAG: magnesium transporter [Actinomycetota bacterium]|nr:magnesium transporter [Actinomycetota bacterium]
MPGDTSGCDSPADPCAKPRDLAEVIGDCAVYEHGRRRAGTVTLEDACRRARDCDGFVWIGLQQPTAQDIAQVAAKFSLPPLAVEDAVQAHQRPKLQVHDDVLFVVLKPVRYVDHDEVVTVSELAIFLGERFIVTVRHGDSDILTRVRRACDRGDTHVLSAGPLGVLHGAADLVVDGYTEAIAGIEEDVDSIETSVFGEDEQDHSERIYMLKREVAEFRRAVLPLAGPLERLADGRVPGVSENLAPYFRDVHDHAVRAAEAIEHHDRLLFDILQADLARAGARQSRIAARQNEIAVRQNEDMRRISAWAAIGLVPTAIAGVYGMNFENIPETRWHYGYFCVLGLIAVSCGLLYRAFRRNGWL